MRHRIGSRSVFSGLRRGFTIVRILQVLFGVLAVSPGIWLACSEDRVAGPLPVVQVKITPDSATLIQGQQIRLQGLALDKTFAFEVGKKVYWNALDPAVATVDSAGLVTAVAPGSARIVAAVLDHTDTAVVTVVAVPVDSVAVAPDSAQVILTQTKQLTATTFDSTGTVVSGRQIDWSSDNSSIAQVDSLGLVTGVGLGTATITATSEGKTGSATIVVVPVPVSTVTLSPNPLAVQLGTSAALTAVTKDSAGGVLTGRVVTWSSSDTTIASVDSTGNVSGKAVGSVTVTATSEGKNGTATVNVSVPVIALASNTASFTAQAFGGNPASQAINVTNGGSFTLNGLSSSVAYTTGSGWLTATLGGATAPTSIQLQPITSGLAVGTYTATVTIASSVQGVASKTIGVTFTVTQQPTISLSSGTASFTAQAFGANPASQTVSVTNTGGGTLSGLSASISYTTGTGWLSASLDQTTAPAVLTLQPATGSLATGTYTATVTVASSVAGVTSKTVAVTFTVTAQPVITLSGSTASFTAQAFGSNPASQAVTITNTGGGTLSGLSASISYATGSGWLSATLGSATAPTSVTLQPATGTLAAGTYTATVTIASTVGGVTSKTIVVTFTVTPQPIISLSAGAANFGATPGGPDPTSQTVNVTNTGGGTLSGLSASVSYSTGSGWLTASLDQTTAPAVLTLQPITGALTTGTYTATVTVASTVPGVTSQTVTVTFAISSTPIISLSTGAATFNATANQSTPSPQGVVITNTGGGTLSGLSVGVSYGTGSGWLTASLGGTTAPTTVTLQPNTTALAGGTYTATVTVSSSLPGVASQTISVTYSVAAEQVISLGSSTASFTAQAFGSDPSSQGIGITNGGTGTLSGLSVGISYTTGSGWLTTASLGSTTAPTTVTLQPTTGSLAAGTYTATVTVSSSIPGVASQTIDVTFTVTQQPVISLSSGALSFSAQAFNSPDASQMVNVTNVGGGTLSGLSTGISYGSGSGWLTANLGTTTAPTAITVTADPAALSAGTYTATITVSSTVPGVSSQTIDVTFNVTPQPVITHSGADTLFFTAQAFNSSPSPQSFTITNTGGGTLSGLSAGANYVPFVSAWLGWSQSSSTAPSTFQLTPSPASLSAGTYIARLVISSTVPGVANDTVVAKFTVTAQPAITLGSSGTTLTLTRGSNSFPSTSVTNTGGGTLSGMSVSSNAAWLTASLTSTTAPATLNATIATSSLTSGSYLGTLTVSSTVPGVTSATYTVNLTVQQPQIAVATNSVTLSVRTAGTTTTTSSTVAVTNSGAGTLSGLSCGDNAAWITCSLNVTTAPATLTITGNPTGLARGTYSGTVTVSSSIPGTTTQNITVSMQVRYSYATNGFNSSIGSASVACQGCHSVSWTYANIVGQTNPGDGSCTAGSWWLVLSGSPTSSLIYRKLTSSPGCGSEMPLGGPFWSTTRTDSFYYWILDGAAP